MTSRASCLLACSALVLALSRNDEYVTQFALQEMQPFAKLLIKRLPVARKVIRSWNIWIQ